MFAEVAVMATVSKLKPGCQYTVFCSVGSSNRCWHLVWHFSCTCEVFILALAVCTSTVNLWHLLASWVMETTGIRSFSWDNLAKAFVRRLLTRGDQGCVISCALQLQVHLHEL